MIDKALLTYLEGYITEKRKALFKKVLNERTRHFTVVLEDMYQPHNTSAVVRSCDIFGIQDLYTIEKTHVSKVSRHVAKGSQKWLTFNRNKSDGVTTQQCFEELRLKGYQIIGTSPHYQSSLLSDFDVTKKTAFVFGAEKDGISEYVQKNADGFLTIPMFGFTESLNISVAVAIILQNVTSRIRKSNVNWHLSKSEQQELYMEWIQKTIKNKDKIIQHYYKEKQLNL